MGGKKKSFFSSITSIFRSSRRRSYRVEDYGGGGQKIRWSDEDHGLWVGEQDIDIKANNFIRFQRSSFTEPNSCTTEPEYQAANVA
ncbi:hypothetical protein QJS10_CPA16g01783 [Acorus calamus]|uniref:Uncharacterized protein n=1 Tax=Acorus calamus TaxID=4465 RepID=A0AAV9D0L0_ACOCL|nr:hypothetical protein QJS10_CPA16g01783 [Acorus calamus]